MQLSSSSTETECSVLVGGLIMPRPGPRPYECFRRAWHSEMHQPMRGSLIREMFSSATKKNKQWQEKLPVVVLKAEEIIFSKANSEEEYMDLVTLLNRTNDAIDTIIRRDESTETVEPLRPCIEAALTLGCTPRKSSRSERNISPRCYLPRTTQELAERCQGSVRRPAMGIDGGVTNPRNARCHALGRANVPVSLVYSLYYGSCTPFVKDVCGFTAAPLQCDAVGSSSGAPRSVNVDAIEESNQERGVSSPECDLSLRLGHHPIGNIQVDPRPRTVDP